MVLLENVGNPEENDGALVEDVGESPSRDDLVIVTGGGV